MKINVFLSGLIIVSLSFGSCSADKATEELSEIEQLQNLDIDNLVDTKAIDKEEIGEDDT